MPRLALALAALMLTANATFAGAAQTAEGDIALLGQSAWVGRGQDFVLRVRVDARASDLEVAVTVFPAVPNRSEFARNVENRVRGPAVSVTSSPLGDLARDETGAAEIRIPIQDPSGPRDRGRTLLRGQGVYPVSVELREVGGGPVADRFTTHLIHLPDPIEGPRLGVAMVLPIAASPTTRLSGADTAALSALIDAVAARPDLQLTLAPNAETLQHLTERPALEVLAATAARRHVVAGPYVRALLPAYDDLDAEAARQTERGRAVVSELLAVAPDTTTAVVQDGLDVDSLNRLRSNGAARVVIPERELESIPLQVTLAQPFELESRGLDAAVADPGLAEHFTGRDPVLAAHHLLADLAVLYFDSPGRTRAVVALPPRTWRPAAGFLAPLFDALAEHPILDAMDLRRMFELVPPVTGRRGAPLLRSLAADGDEPDLPGAAIRSARRALDAFSTMAGAGTEMTVALSDRLLAAQSADLRPSARSRAVAAARADLRRQLSAIRIPTNRSITLTATRGEIPITVQRDVPYSVKVVVRLTSDKLRFPSGASAVIDLTRRNTTRRFTVQARSSGTFPVQVQVTTPDGRLMVGEGTFTITSRSVSGVGIAVSAAALAFLIVWWGRHIWRTRHARS